MLVVIASLIHAGVGLRVCKKQLGGVRKIA